MEQSVFPPPIFLWRFFSNKGFFFFSLPLFLFFFILVFRLEGSKTQVIGIRKWNTSIFLCLV